jgi:cytochrome c1
MLQLILLVPAGDYNIKAHNRQSGTLRLFYACAHTIPYTKYSLVSPGPKHSSATNKPLREISSVPLCA